MYRSTKHNAVGLFHQRQNINDWPAEYAVSGFGAAAAAHTAAHRNSANVVDGGFDAVSVQSLGNLLQSSVCRLIDGDDSDPAFAGFNEELKPELVYCSLQEAIDDETAEDYVLDELVEDEACPEELRTRAYLKHEVIEGRLYYYYIFKYKKSRKQRQKFAAACDIGGGLFYTIETEWIWRKEELTLEALIDFLKIRVE